ncbi:ATP synthase F1 subunit delta [Candidatus Avelusimicrobium alvi]|uniref:ATP synthase F1 subunit delta n=1 Tax=Candidatus Avelusimicrobium alvi TaxID=3416221 RepID=UPI003D0ABEDB
MNSSDRIAVQRYAAAYNGLSASNEESARRAADLRAAQEALSAVRKYMTSPRVSSEQKKQTVKDALQGAPETASFVELLIDAKRYGLLEAVTRRVGELLDERLGIMRAEVASARELSPAQKKAAEEALSARYGGRVEASFITDPALLGGLKIRCRGELIDGSLQGRLAKLQEELTH